MSAKNSRLKINAVLPASGTRNAVNDVKTIRSNAVMQKLKEVRRTNNLNEHDIQNAIRLKLSELGFAVFRANVGKFKLADGRFFDVGLPKGFSDLFAIKDGRIYFLEVKDHKGRASKEQLNFISQMQSKGCIAGIVRSVDDAVELVSSKKSLD